MERCSFFIKDKALFGSYPSQESVEILETNGVRYFVDLTEEGERKINPYTTNYRIIKYPIKDRKVPHDWCSFAALIVYICDLIKKLAEGEKIYIHCKGGHGRSGILVACLLCYKFRLKPEQALELTNRYHSERQEMKEKWRKIGSPQCKIQKDFVFKFFSPLIYSNVKYGTVPSIFSNFYPSEIQLNNLIIKNAHVCYLYLLKLDDREFSEDKKIDTMYSSIQYKFSQHHELKKFLLNTGFRILIKRSKDIFWGKNDESGKNIHGQLLMKLRKRLLKKEIEKTYFLPQQLDV